MNLIGLHGILDYDLFFYLPIVALPIGRFQSAVPVPSDNSQSWCTEGTRMVPVPGAVRVATAGAQS